MSVVIADVDDVADMVAGLGAGAAGLWFAAHEAHGALVAQWMRSEVDVVIAVGPVYTTDEQHALFGNIPAGAQICRVLIDAAIATTWERVSRDRRTGMSGQRDFHERMHERFRTLRPDIPADLVFDSHQMTAAAIASTIFSAIATAS